MTYPLLFHPILKERIWGGRNLAGLGKALPPGQRIGESWELADLPGSIEDGRSVIANGPLAGRTLHDAIASSREEIMGAASLTGEGGFPMLIKLLDAAQNLSVQVHPGAAYVAAHPGTHLKSEAWVILKAIRGAVIYKGVKPRVTPEAFAAHIRTGAVVDDLVTVAVSEGECHYLPSGTCHALGASIVVAEVQTPSDTTFRVYDWGRTGRPLHVAEALECISFGQQPRGPEKPGVPITIGELTTTPLAATEHFGIERIESGGPASLDVVTSGIPAVWMVLRGGGRIGSAGGEVRLATGATVLIPAALEGAEALLGRATVLLRITPPSPLQGLIA